MDYPSPYDEREYNTPPPQVAAQNEKSSTGGDTIDVEPQSEPEDDEYSLADLINSSAAYEMEDSVDADISSNFGDIFQYEHDVSFDILHCSTPAETSILQDQRIFRAAHNDSIRRVQGDRGLNVSWVESHIEFDSDNNQPYHIRRVIPVPHQVRRDLLQLQSSLRSGVAIAGCNLPGGYAMQGSIDHER